MNKDLYLKTFSDNSWELYNNNSLELCSNSYKEYLDVFKDISKDVSYEKPSNILIVGGGDKQIYNYLLTKINPESTVTIIDPLVGDFLEFEKLYTDVYVKSPFFNLIEIKEVFSESYDSISDLKYDIIIVDCSEEIVEDTKEIYCEEFLLQLKNLSYSKTDIFFYLPSKMNSRWFSEIVHKNFVSDYTAKYIPAWGENCTYLKLRLYKQPHTNKHVHFHSNFIFNQDENEHLKNINHSIIYEYLFNVVSKYCTIMDSSSYPFSTGGFSGSFILGESHFNWHTYPENNLITFDLYHCNYREELINIFTEIRENFSSESLKSSNVSRHIFNPLDPNFSTSIEYFNLEV